MKTQLFIAFALLLAMPLAAQQLSFKKETSEGQTHFKYRWLDIQDKKQNLAFTFENKTMFGRFRNFKGYQPSRVKKTILVALKKAAAKIDRRKVDINFIERPTTYSISIKGKNKDLREKAEKMLLAVRDKAQAKILKKAYYNILTDKFGKTGVKPDHVRFAMESRKDILPLTQAIVKANPKLRGRQVAEYILGFIQSIPYSTLESRRESHGAGFSPPLRLLNNNQGDCDSKVTLMANMLNAMFPRVKVVIIYMPNHALIGVQMTHRKNDKWIKLKDREYILAEPTGPAMLPFGKIGKQSEFFVDGLQFTYEIF
ncbi:MAG: hypothetical protein MJK04_21690 [Psychrosphaera sp.]|nr:hypothetical protein [Psychrosphaera sp.]